MTYATDEAVHRCLSENPHNVQGREVETKKAIPRTEKEETESFTRSKKVGMIFSPPSPLCCLSLPFLFLSLPNLYFNSRYFSVDYR